MVAEPVEAWLLSLSKHFKILKTKKALDFSKAYAV
jgi:hypothetical protein